MNQEAALLEERIRLVERDLAELAEQVELGEIDAATAEGLREKYESERRSIIEQLSAEATTDANAGSGSMLSGTRLLGIGLTLIAVVAAGLWLMSNTGNDTSGVEGVAQDVLTGDAINLADVTNEQMEAVVAQNPDIAPMRLALAERYFVAGDFQNALRHYMYILETMGVKDPTALANVGWMTYLSGAPDVAESFVEESLEIQPDGGIAFWYLAAIRFNGLDDAAGAIEPLQKLLAYEELPDEIRANAEGMLAEAEAAQ